MKQKIESVRKTKLYINDIKIDIFACHFRMDPISRPIFTLYIVCLKGMLNTTHTATECAYQVFDG